MKYKVGDKVKIKTWDQMDEEFGLYEGCIKTYGCDFVTEMEKELNELNCDRILTIKNVVSKELHNYYQMEEMRWGWTDTMIEDYVKPEPVKNRWEILDL